jgi:Domain of unknown function (DUF4159)
MKLFSRILAVVLLLGLSTALVAFQRDRFQSWRFEEGAGDSGEKTEWAFTRLRYATRAGDYGGWGRFRGGGWAEDYPKADRQFVEGVRRLTRLDARSTQQVVDLESDELFNWPWLYAVNVSDWDFTDAQAKRLREYLLKGGFLMVDHFHGTADWEGFLVGMRKVLPDRLVVDLPNKDEIFHVLYDLDERFQVPGYQYLWTGKTFEKDGIEPHWRAIRDEKGRIMVAICHNMHLGDAWEHADNPRYPERFSSLAYRLGINYIIYGMTH